MLALVMGIIGFVATANAVYGCYFIRIDGYLLPGSPYFVETEQRYGVGLLSYQSPEINSSIYCYAYTSSQLGNYDSRFRAARAMGMIALICSGVVLVFLLALGCMALPVPVLKGFGALALLGSFCEILTMIIFSSAFVYNPWNGTFWIGAGLAIVGFVFGIATGLLCFWFPPAADPFAGLPPPQAFQPGTTTTTETTLPDGTKKITKTTVNPDGSQTIEETVVKPN